MQATKPRQAPPRPDTATLRRLAVRHSVDPRTILRELDEPGSVGGMAGERARRAREEIEEAEE
jgi:hypothetical protein